MPPKPTHTHQWHRINQTLAQCECGKLKTVRPKVPRPKPGIQNDPDGMQGIRVSDAAEKYGMSKDAIYNAWKNGYIYRISTGLYDEVSLKKYVEKGCLYGHLRDTTKTVSFGATKGSRVAVPKFSSYPNGNEF
jgi:uncharacterized protein YjcR